jgi:hypothetical protein
VISGEAICALFRGEDSERALIGGMIIADMAIRLRYFMGAKPPDEES